MPASGADRSAARLAGNRRRFAAIAAGAVGQVSAEQFVGAFTAERDLSSCPAQLGQKPQRQCASVRAWAHRSNTRTPIAPSRSCSGLKSNSSCSVSYSWPPSCGCNRSRRNCGRGTRSKMFSACRLEAAASVVQDGRRIHATAEPDAQRHVRKQCSLHRLSQQRIQFLAAAPGSCGCGRGQAPIGLGTDRPLCHSTQFRAAPCDPSIIVQGAGM